MRKYTVSSAWVIFAILVCTARDTRAGGLEFPDLGTVALGRGAAFVARADNPSAFYYNPAGLSKSKGPNLLLGSNIVNLNLSFARSGGGSPVWVDAKGVDYGRACDPMIGDICADNPAEDYSDVSFVDGVFDPEDYRSISLKNRFGPAPMLVFSWGDVFDVEGLALSFGLLTPSGFGMPEYPQDGAQRYLLRDSNQLMVLPGLGVSYAFNRYFQIGGVFLSGLAFIEMTQTVRLLIQSGSDARNENIGGDAVIGLETKDVFMPTGIIGVLSNPLDWLEIGVSVKLPVQVNTEGKITEFKAPPVDLSDAQLVEGKDNISLAMSFPWVVRAGVRYIHQYFDVEADFVFENWSSLQYLDIKTDAVIEASALGGPSEFPDVKVPMNYRDTYSVRLGSDVEVWPEHIAVRLGGFYQSSAYPENNETFSLVAPFGQQIGVGGGLTWHACDYMDVNVAYLHIFQPEVTVKEGVVQQMALPYTQIDPTTGEVAAEIQTGNIVNNGVYQVSMNIFGVSLEGHF